MLIGHQKGRDTKERVRRNYGMPKPEGYRKALRLMSWPSASVFPVITLIDTPGAYPGVGSEERGQSEAIARNLFEMSMLAAPILSVVIGEGGIGRSARDRRVRSTADAAVQYLFGDLPRRVRVDPVEERRQKDVAAEALNLPPIGCSIWAWSTKCCAEPLGGAHRDPAR